MAGWYYLHENHPVGPVEERALFAAFNENAMSRDTLVWQEGRADWVKAASLPQFAPVAAIIPVVPPRSLPPPPIPPPPIPPLSIPPLPAQPLVALEAASPETTVPQPAPTLTKREKLKVPFWLMGFALLILVYVLYLYSMAGTPLLAGFDFERGKRAEDLKNLDVAASYYTSGLRYEPNSSELLARLGVVSAQRHDDKTVKWVLRRLDEVTGATMQNTDSEKLQVLQAQKGS